MFKYSICSYSTHKVIALLDSGTCLNTASVLIQLWECQKCRPNWLSLNTASVLIQRKCHTCLCQTCLTVCGKCTDCKEKTESCDGYNGFWQESIFGIPQETPYQGTPRHSLAYYGLTDERVEELEKLIQSGRYTALASQAAHTANEMIEEYILLSVTQNKSYDALRVKCHAPRGACELKYG